MNDIVETTRVALSYKVAIDGAVVRLDLTPDGAVLVLGGTVREEALGPFPLHLVTHLGSLVTAALASPAAQDFLAANIEDPDPDPDPDPEVPGEGGGTPEEES